MFLILKSLLYPTNHVTIDLDNRLHNDLLDTHIPTLSYQGNIMRIDRDIDQFTIVTVEFISAGIPPIYIRLWLTSPFQIVKYIVQ